MSGYRERPTIAADSLTEATFIALRLYEGKQTHILVDRTSDPKVFRVRTRGGRA